MARGRMIDKRVSMSSKIGKITDKSRVLWFMMYPHLDREGRVAFDNLEDLKFEIIPRLNNWGLKKIAQALNELADVNLIKLYPSKEKIAIQFVKFENFQIGLRKDREAKSEIDPPGVVSKNSGNFRITPALSISKIKEVNEVKEVKKKNTKKKKDPSLFETEFKEFWDLYPRKTQKQDAKETFMVRCRQGLSADIIKALKGYLKFLKYQRIQNNFNQAPMYPKTFLNKNRWKEFINFEYTEPGKRTSRQTPKEQNYWKDREKKIVELAKRGLSKNEIQIEISKWSKKYWEKQPNKGDNK